MLYLPSEFPQDQELCYLNHAAVGPWPRRTAQAVSNFAQQNMTRGAADYPQWLTVEERLRKRIAWLIDADDTADIALVKNTSEGLSIVSQGLDWKDGDQIVGLAGDFISNQMPWEVLGAQGVSYVPIDALSSKDPEGALIDALKKKTRLLAISTVHFATGYRFDMQRLSEACRAKDVLLCVDGIQSFGAQRFSLKDTPADFVTAGGHKWLLSPEGLGFFYCRPELRDRLSLHQFGWAMRDDTYAFESTKWEAAHSARRFEPGTPNMMGIHALEASLSLFEEVGFDFIEQRLADNMALLQNALTEIPGVKLVTPGKARKRAGIMTFTHKKKPAGSLYPALMDAGVICAARGGGIRLAPHFYTPQGVIDRAVNTISQLIQTL